MKKTLTALLLVSLMMILPANVFADEEQEVSGNSANVTLYATKNSTYYVKLPVRVDVSAVSETFTVLAKGDIASSEELTIGYASGTYNLVDTVAESTKTPVALNVSVTNPTFAYTDLGNTYGQNGATFTISHNALQAGAYECVLPVTISLDSAS